MNEVVIEIRIKLPDGVTPDVAYSAAPAVVAATLQQLDQPPLPEPPDLFSEAQRVFAAEVKQNDNPPVCRIHNQPMTYRPAGPIKSGPKQGQQRGAFYSCGIKDAAGNWCKSRQDAA